MKKANANATDRKPSGAVDSDPSPERLPETGSGDGSDAMTADEMAVFEKIIGEIEGQAKSSMDNAATDAENRNEPPGNDLQGLASASSQDSGDDDLDAAQQKAFESIMAQIGGGGGGYASKEASAEPLPVESRNGSDAELELVSRESERVATDASAVEPDEGAGDDLDAEQQKAFESIMAQIGGGGGDKGDASDAPTVDSSEDAETDDFSAELEKVARESEAVDANESKTKPADTSGGDLDEAQPKASASVMTEVAGEAESPPTKAPETISKAVPEPPAIGDGADAEAEEETHDISDDIDDLLREITGGEGDSDADPESAAAEDDSESHDPSDDAIIVQQEDDVQAETKATPSPDASDGKAGRQREQPVVRKEQKPGLSEDDTGFTDSGTPKPVAPLRESRPAGGVKKKTGLLACVLILLGLAPAVYFYRIHAMKQDYTPPSPVIRQIPDLKRQPDDRPPEPVSVPDEPSDQMRLKSVAEEIDRLRDELIAKQSEIKELRDYYQAGIEAEIQSIVDIRNQMDNSPVSYKTAMTDPRISLGLSAIQRRDAYIKKLEQPAHALFINGEELLYLSRKAGLIGVMAGKTSDIDIDGFVKQVEETIAAHRQGLTHLNIDAVDVPSVSLESIWQQIDTRMPKKQIASAPSPAVARTQDTAIGEQLCNGDFTRRDKLTVLTPEVARCLAVWKGKDLYLNELSELSPEAARELAGWEGDWLGLNGLGALSPETARHLSRWKGKGLSLNGLTRISPQAVAILSEWQGDQIELINLKHLVHWENPKTRLFLSETMKRKAAARGTQP